MEVVAYPPAGWLPSTLRCDMFGPGDRQRGDGLDREAALVGLGRVRRAELLAADLRRRRLVHPDLGVDPPPAPWRALDHQVAANLVEVVAQRVGKAPRGRVQQQSRVSMEYPGGSPSALVDLNPGREGQNKNGWCD